MANPEQGPVDNGPAGTWQTLRIEAPDFLEVAREAVTGVVGTLVSTLQVLSSVLEILKANATGLLDPLVAVLQALRSLLQNMLLDIRQAGVYLHGDFYALEAPDFKSLLGGFDAYQARMVARFTDPSDPNRPVFSEDTAALAIFLYAQADIRRVDLILSLLQKIATLFGRRPPRSPAQTIVNNLQATYGYEGASIFSYNRGFFKGFLPRTQVKDNLASPYNAVNLTWKMAGPQGTPLDLPQIPPAGFIVEFSTISVPLPILCERPADGTLEGIDVPSVGDGRVVVQVEDMTGLPLFLSGGLDTIQVEEGLQYNDPVTANGLAPDAVRVFAVRSLADPAPIQLSDLKEDGRYYLQRSFFVPFSQNMFFPGRGFGATFQYKDLPYSAEWERDGDKVRRVRDDKQPELYHVRVRAVSRDIKSVDGFQYILDNSSLRSSPPIALLTQDAVPSDSGPLSSRLELIFPDASTERYLRAVAEALAVLVLSRSDLPVLRGKTGTLNYPGPGVTADGQLAVYWSDFSSKARTPTSLESIAQVFLPRLLGRREPSAYFSEAAAPPVFRSRTFAACLNLTNRLFQAGPPSLPARQLAVQRAQALLDLRVTFTATGYQVTTTPNQPGQTLLELLGESDLPEGLAISPASMGISGDRASVTALLELRSEGSLARRPGFFMSPAGGSADNSPILYKRVGRQVQQVGFVRNVLSEEVYESAKFVLELATSPAIRPKEDGWLAFKLLPQGFPSAERFIDKILALLDSVEGSSNSLAETILGYLDFIEARIRQLQALLNQLQALLDLFLRFFAMIQPTSGLIVTGFGTSGLINGLLSAENKPLPSFQDRDSYGGGVVFVAGGLPAPILEVIRKLFKTD